MKELSKCCNKPKVANYTDEGTGAYLCQGCLGEFIPTTPKEEEIYENDDPEISMKDFEEMYVSQAKNLTDAMERRFNIWLEERDDDFEIDIWDFRCLQDFIFQERHEAIAEGEERVKKVIKGVYQNAKEDHICRFNDGDCKCECYYTAINDVIRHLTQE